MTARLAIALLLPCSLFLTSCQTGDIKAVLPIAGGGTVSVILRPGGPVPGEAEGFRMQSAALTPAKEAREVFYRFALIAEKAPAVRRIQIEDVSDEEVIPLVDDTKPEFKDGHWQAETPVIQADDPRLAWVMRINASMRVYRVTLTTTTDRRISFHHVVSYPEFFKAAIRAKWGEKY